jgi:hypothetical protein
MWHIAYYTTSNRVIFYRIPRYCGLVLLYGWDAKYKVPMHARAWCMPAMTRVHCICMHAVILWTNRCATMHEFRTVKKVHQNRACLPSYIEFLIYVLFKEYIYSDYISTFIRSTINVKRILNVFNNIFDKKGNVAWVSL